MPDSPQITVCHSCDALLRITPAQHSTFRCPRCGTLVHRAGLTKRLDDALAFGLAAALFFILANSFPIVSIDSGGDRSYATLLGTALALHAQGLDFVAWVVALTTFFIPAVELGCALAILCTAKFKLPIPATFLFRARKALHPWSMIEIFILGTLVALVKLGNLGTIVLNIGIWSLGTFMILNALASHAFENIEFWSRTENQ